MTYKTHGSIFIYRWLTRETGALPFLTDNRFSLLNLAYWTLIFSCYYITKASIEHKFSENLLSEFEFATRQNRAYLWLHVHIDDTSFRNLTHECKLACSGVLYDEWKGVSRKQKKGIQKSHLTVNLRVLWSNITGDFNSLKQTLEQLLVYP
jgi:hypothetical protein